MRESGLYKRIVLYGLLLVSLPLLAAKHMPSVPDSLQRIVVPVNGITVTMQRVEGGSFMMGATPEQSDPDLVSDKPAHLVFLSPYYMATTEVTYALWHAVMPERETLTPKGYSNHPINYVSWHDCQTFVRRLDSITGLPFRLPTEAEWEFAARGGIKSRKYRFAGSNIADSVGWLYSCSGNWTHPVARKHPNELGIYDLTGNVAEWCQDLYGAYRLGTNPNPCGADTGSYRVVRGSSYDECLANSHLSVRRWFKPETSTGYIGLRLALTLPDDPIMQPAETNKTALSKTVRIKGRTLRFVYVPAEQPYYISEEISVTLWKKMMRHEPEDKQRSIALGMSYAARQRFAEECSLAAQERLFVASAEEIVAAEQERLIEPYEKEEKNRYKSLSIRQIQRRRKAADRWSPLTELVGFRLPKPDDPILLQYKKEDDESRPLRLVIRTAD